MDYWRKAISAAILLLLILGNVVAQENGKGTLIIRGAVEKGRDPLPNAKVELYRGNSKVKTITTQQKGEFEIRMDINHEYTISFKKDDYVSKKIFVDATVPEGESGTWTVEFSIGLFKMYPGLDVSDLKNPVTKIIYIEDDRGFGYDRLYTEKMMAKIDKIMRQLERLKEEAYREIIRKGDRKFDDKQYAEAIDYYQKALDQRPDDRYPRKRLEDAQELLKERKERIALYEKAIARADQLFEQKQYKEAKATYYEAIDYDSSQDYPRQQIRKIDKILNDIRAEKQREAEQLEKYNDYIKQGDRKFSENNYKVAKLSYQNALNIFPNKSYPQEQIQKINKLISEAEAQQALNNEYKTFITKADNEFNSDNYIASKSNYQKALDLKPSETYPQQQIDKINEILRKQKAAEERYSNYIRLADQKFSNEQYQKAKGDYQSALEIKPNEQYPRDQINKINGILDKEKQQLAEYNRIIEQADAAYNGENFEQAKALYSEALFVKPDKQYPKDQIAKIDNELSRQKSIDQNYQKAITEADQYFGQEQYRMAKNNYQRALEFKPDEAYPKQRISEINSIMQRKAQQDQQYASLISQADQQFEGERYTASKSTYNEALDIKPDEDYPQQRIAEIDRILAKLAKEKEKEQQYNSMIKKADLAFKKEEYTNAKSLYSEALFIKPNEQYPKEQINKIDQLLAKMKQEEAARNAEQQAYDEAINKADGLFKMEEYEQSKGFYNEALTIKPGEEYPKSKIDEINSILAKREQQKQAYRAAIEEADARFNEDQYREAKSFYNEALEIKSNEQYPKDQIGKINDILAERQAERERQAKIDEQYQDAISTADQLFNAEAYEDSKIAYNEALKIKPGESYPKQQIEKINSILDQQRARLDEQYNNAVAEGDQKFENEEYKSAKQSYNKALNYKPGKSYPKSQITKIDEILDRLAREKQEKERIERLYAEEIDKGDSKYKNNEYYGARTHYKKALQYKPDEQYPKNRLKLINEILAEFEEAKQASANKKAEEKKQANKKESKLKDFGKFKTKSEERAYLNDLAKKYPEGVTVENYDFDNKKIKRVIVNYDGIATEYRKVKHSWGGTYHFRNGQNISGSVFKVETKERD